MLDTAAPLVLGAAVAGPSHIANGLPCQDAYAHTTTADGTLLVAVADGLGSAARSHVGARMAVTAATTIDPAHDPFDTAVAMIEAAREAVGTDPSLACTFIGVAARPNEVAVVHIGDGAVVADSVLSGPGPSEYVDVTDPLTASDWRHRVRFTSALGVRRIAVFTDGCQRAALLRGHAHPGFFDPLFTYAQRGGDAAGIETLLSGPKLSEHSEDDKTLVLAVLDAS